MKIKRPTKDQAIRLTLYIQGWCQEPTIDWLYNRASEVPVNGTIMEVGVWKGRSLCPMALAAKHPVHIYAVDHFKGNPNSLTHYEGTYLTHGEWSWVRGHVRLLQELVELTTGNKIQVITPDKVNSIKPSIDLLHLDADYCTNPYQQVKSDLDRYIPYVRSGGLVCGNHYLGTKHEHEVLRAVKEVFPAYHIATQESSGGVWAAQKG